MKVSGSAAVAALALACGHGNEAERPAPKQAPATRPAPPKPGHPPISASPEGLLAPSAIRELQKSLTERGYLHEHREGALDEPTSGAIRRFQEHEGLAATGMPDRETLQKLGVDPDKAYRSGVEHPRQ